MENPSGNQTSKGFLRTLRIIHLALLGGVVAFALVQYSGAENPEMRLSEMDFPFPYGVLLIALAGIVAGTFLFRQQLGALRKEEHLAPRLAGYMTASLIRFAMLEGPAFFALVAFGSTGNLAYLLIALVLWMLLLFLFPTPDRTMKDLDLPRELQDEFKRGLDL